MTTDLELAAILRGDPAPEYRARAVEELLEEVWPVVVVTARRLDEVSVALVDALRPWPRPTFED